MAIFFTPKTKETGTMWGTWLYWHEGRYDRSRVIAEFERQKVPGRESILSVFFGVVDS